MVEWRKIAKRSAQAGVAAGVVAALVLRERARERERQSNSLRFVPIRDDLPWDLNEIGVSQSTAPEVISQYRPGDFDHPNPRLRGEIHSVVGQGKYHVVPYRRKSRRSGRIVPGRKRVSKLRSFASYGKSLLKAGVVAAVAGAGAAYGRARMHNYLNLPARRYSF